MRTRAPQWPFTVNWGHPASEDLLGLWVPVPGEWRNLVRGVNATHIGTKRPFYPGRGGGRVFRSAADNDAMDLGNFGVLGYQRSAGYNGATVAACLTPQSAASGAWAGIMVARSASGINGFQKNNTSHQIVESQNYAATALAFTDKARQLMGVRYDVSVAPTYYQTKFVIERGRVSSNQVSQTITQYLYFDDLELARDDNSSTRTMRGEYEWAALWKRAVPLDVLARLEHPAGFAELLYELGRRTYFVPAAVGGGFQAAWARGANSIISAGVRAA